MELRDFLPGIIGSFVGVTGWLLVGLYTDTELRAMEPEPNAAPPAASSSESIARPKP